MDLTKVDIIGVPVTALSFQDQISAMMTWAKERSSRVVCVANVHMLMESRGDNSFWSTLDKADLVTPDGMPLVWMIRLLGFGSQDRVAGMDIFVSVCQRAAAEGVSIYLLGCTQPVIDQMVIKLKRDFPQLKLAGAEPLPFRPLTEMEDRDLVERINSSGAGVMFLSLGCPKQERWMNNHKDRIQSVMVGIGGVFSVYAGLQKRAPTWVRESGLEWLYRLAQEPRRLWHRYQSTIPPFIVLAVRQVLARARTQRSFFQTKKGLQEPSKIRA